MHLHELLAMVMELSQVVIRSFFFHRFCAGGWTTKSDPPGKN